MEIKKLTKYTWSNTPSLVPLRAADLWDEEVVVAAGFDPQDSEVTVTDLAEAWNGHPAGSLVVTELTVEGHRFAVVELEADPVEPTITVAEAKRLIEDAVVYLGPEAQDRYTGSCKQSRNEAVCAVQDGQDAALVARQWFGAEANDEVIPVTVTAGEYTATLTGDQVEIRHLHDGVNEWAGSGEWNGCRIEDCTAELPEGVYEELEAGLVDAD